MADTLTKRQKSLKDAVNKEKLYDLSEALDLVKKTATAKFDETLEVHIRLGIDPKQNEQQVRTMATLPHGTGKTKTVAVIAKGEKVKEAKTAGADHAGEADLIEKISKGWMDFDVLVATPDVMKDLAKLGKTLGPKGLMPNPKTGTVTFDLAKAVKEIKGGRIEIRADANGNIHAGIGKISFDKQKLLENAQTLLDALTRAKPNSVKGAFIKTITLCSTMGPGVPLRPTAGQEQ